MKIRPSLNSANLTCSPWLGAPARTQSIGSSVAVKGYSIVSLIWGRMPSH